MASPDQPTFPTTPTTPEGERDKSKPPDSIDTRVRSERLNAVHLIDRYLMSGALRKNPSKYSTVYRDPDDYTSLQESYWGEIRERVTEKSRLYPKLTYGDLEALRAAERLSIIDFIFLMGEENKCGKYPPISQGYFQSDEEFEKERRAADEKRSADRVRQSYFDEVQRDILLKWLPWERFRLLDDLPEDEKMQRALQAAIWNDLDRGRRRLLPEGTEPAMHLDILTYSAEQITKDATLTPAEPEGITQDEPGGKMALMREVFKNIFRRRIGGRKK